MRTISADNEKLLTAEGGWTTTIRVFVKDVGAAWRDLTTYPGENMVLGATWQEDIDSPGYTAEIRLRRQVESLSLSPLQEGSPLNKQFNPATSYAALIDIRREVKIEWILYPLERDPVVTGAAWTKAFHGYIDTVKFAEDEMVLECSDQFALLRDTWIERERVYAFAQGGSATKGCYIFEPSKAYALNELVVPTQANANAHYYKCTTAGTTGSTEAAWNTGGGSTTTQGAAVFTEQGSASTSAGTAVQTVMQQLIDDHITGGPTLYVPTSPGWNIRWYLQQRQSVWDALRSLAEQLGWEVRYKWDNGTGDFRLTLWSVDRSKTSPDRTWGAYDQPVAIEQLELDIKDIRNAVCVKYSDSQAVDAGGNPTRKEYTSTNSTSITNYGRRYMEASEDGNSNIDTGAEAQTFADNMCSDLALPIATHAARSMFFPFAELGDLYQYPANDQHYSVAQKVAPTSIAHEVSAGGVASTTIGGRMKVAGGYGKWLKRDVRASPGGRHATTQLPSAGITLGVNDAVGGTILRASVQEAKHSPGSRYEFHVSASSSFTPSSATLKQEGASREAVVTDLIPGKGYYGAIVPITFNAGKIIRGQKSAETSFTAGRGKTGHLEDKVSWGNLPLNGGFETQTDPNAPPDHWTMLAGTWATNAVLMTDGNGTSGGSYVKLVTTNGTDSAGLYSAKFLANERMQSLGEVWAKTVAGSGNNFYVSIAWYDYDDAFVGSYDEIFSLATDVGVWKPYRIAAQAPAANAAFMRFAIQANGGGSGREVHIDSARFWQEEAWREVGASGEPTFSNSWVNYVSTFQTAAFRRDNEGRVHIKGLVKSGTIGTNVFTLPVGYRPPLDIHIPVVSNGALGVMIIRSNGGVEATAGNNTYFSTECSFDPW